jgi:two-component system sensor histidine kinase ChiS
VPASPFGNILVGALICVAFAIFDIFDSLYLHYSTLLSPVGFFIFTIGIALVLIRRSVNFYIKQDRIIARTNKLINARLVDCVVVQDRDPYDIPSSTEKIAIMFTDVRNFTGITEKMDSKAVTGFLCSLWEVLVKPLHYYEKHGFVAYTDKFIGDAMMNVFTDPLVALKAAVYFRVQLREFNQNQLKYFKELTNKPYIDIGTGIAYGDATVGIMGHRSRLDYTSLGDTVNLASRIEGLTKTYHSPTLISDLVYEKISDASLEEFNLRLVDRIRVVGKKEAVAIYEEYSSNNPVIVELKRVTKNLMNELQVAYFSNSVSNLEHALRLCDHIENYFLKEIVRCNAAPEKPGDWLPSIYRKRIQNLLANPKKLERWDGIYTFENK